MRWFICLTIPFLFGFSLPRGATVEVVGEGLIQNGLQMDIYYYQHRDEPGVFADRLKSIFVKESDDLVIKTLDEGVLSVGFIAEKKYVSVTIQPNRSGGSEGFLTKTDLRPQKIPDAPISLPHSIKLISHTLDPVGGGKKETWVYYSKRELVWINNQLKQQNLKEVFRSIDGSVMYEGIGGRSRLQVTVSGIENGTGLVITK